MSIKVVNQKGETSPFYFCYGHSFFLFLTFQNEIKKYSRKKLHHG